MWNPWMLVAGIFAIIAVSAGLMFAYNIQFNATQITIISVLFIVVIIAVVIWTMFGSKGIKIFSSSSSNESQQMMKADNVARDYWRTIRGEELSYDESHGMERTFGKDTVYGLLFHRLPQEGTKKAGMAVAFVVRTNPLRVVRWSDHPSPEEQENPFKIWSSGYTGSPVLGLTPDQDASFHRGGFGGRPGQTINIGPRDGEMDDFFSGKKRETN